MNKKRIIIGSSGASGFPLLLQCLRIIKEDSTYESYLIMSNAARLTLKEETGITFDELRSYCDYVLDINDIGAITASGTFHSEGMLIVPCSMKTVAGIVSGYSENLLLRTADVMIKEQRKLILAAREAPLSTIHLRNLYELSKIQNVRIIPPMMTFYHHPSSIEEMVYQISARLLEPFGIIAKEYFEWKGL